MSATPWPVSAYGASAANRRGQQAQRVFVFERLELRQTVTGVCLDCRTTSSLVEHEGAATFWQAHDGHRTAVSV